MIYISKFFEVFNLKTQEILSCFIITQYPKKINKKGAGKKFPNLSSSFRKKNEVNYYNDIKILQQTDNFINIKKNFF